MRFKVTGKVNAFPVWYVEADTWQEAKAQVEDGEVEVDNMDDVQIEDAEVIFIDDAESGQPIYEEGYVYEPETEE